MLTRKKYVGETREIGIEFQNLVKYKNNAVFYYIRFIRMKLPKLRELEIGLL